MLPICATTIKSRIQLRVLCSFDFSAEFVDVGQWLIFATDERVRFWEKFIFNANCGNVTLLQFFNEPSHVVKVAVAGITIQQEWEWWWHRS